jgi:hypothetical protein
MPALATHLLLKMWLMGVAHDNDSKRRRGYASSFNRSVRPEEQIKSALCFAGYDKDAANRARKQSSDLLG